MSDHSYDVSGADFDRRVLDPSHRVPVLVDFWAPWCSPCKVLKPILERLAVDYGGRFILAKVNSDENQELAATYGVRGIPNVKAFVRGKLADEFTGALPEHSLREFIDRLIPSLAEPLRLEAAAARSRGEAAVARALLQRALETDPSSESARLDLVELELDSGNIDVARDILSANSRPFKDHARAESLRAHLSLAQAGPERTLQNWRAGWRAMPATLRSACDSPTLSPSTATIAARSNTCWRLCAATGASRMTWVARPCSPCSACSPGKPLSKNWFGSFG